MANLYITEFRSVAHDATGLPIPVGDTPRLANQKVSFTTSTQSAVFNQQTSLIRLISDADCHIAFGDNPTATASQMFVKANTAEYFGVRPGDKLAVYDGTS